MTRALVIALLAFAAQTTAHAAPPAELVNEIAERQLWLAPTWQKLLHYESIGELTESAVDDPRFFLAPNGPTTPMAELLATLDALWAEEPLNDEHAQCRFVARLNWLKESTAAFPSESLPQPNCSAWEEFRGLVKAQSATLIFPSYYLNSPSSMFGHTLLRLDGEQADGGAEWLSFAVNFAAEVDQTDGTMFYAFKGLTGAYPGEYNIDLYYKKIQEYNRDENRDIWEYPLNLTPAETQRIIEHIWELRDVRFDYYFFDENCSYRILELLELARPNVDLTSSFRLTAIPIDTVRVVKDAGMITDKTFRPSKGSVLRELIDRVPKEQHSLILALADDASLLDSERFLALDPPQQAQIAEAAYKYLRFRQIGKAREETTVKNSFALLQRIRALASDREPDAEPEALVSPDFGHESRRWSVGGLHENDDDWLTLGLRFSLHDLTDNAPGFLPGAAISLGDFALRVSDEGQVRWDHIDLIRITSLSTRTPFFRPLSWSIATGLERQWSRNRSHNAIHVTGGVGGTWSWWSQQRVYALATFRLENSSDFDDAVAPAIGLNMGALQLHGSLASRIELSGEKFANGRERARVSWTQSLAVSRNQSLSLTASYQRFDDLDFGAAEVSYQLFR